MELSEEQLEEVRQFNEGLGQRFFSELQAIFIAEWLSADSVEQREECWRLVQCANRLQSLLRDAKAMNALSRRARERLYERTTKGV